MTVRMEESKIPQVVILVIAIAVVQFKGFIGLYHLSADQTQALLLAQDLSTTA